MPTVIHAPVSPEVRAYAEAQRMREFEAVNLEVKQTWLRKIGTKVLDVFHSHAEEDSIEWQRLMTDQVTEASERLNGVMENTFEYTLEGGELYFQGEALRPIFVRGIQNTEELVRSQPQFSVELLRRHIELLQYEQQLALLRNADLEDTMLLVHISPTPDAVLKDGVELNAYDKVRKKIMVRVSEATKAGLRVTSFSLDGNDRVALQAMAAELGLDIPDDATSEDILEMAGCIRRSQLPADNAVQFLRSRYDAAMSMQYGGEWYGGRQDSDVLSTMQKIMRYPKLIKAHTNEVMRLKKRLGRDFRFTKDYDTATYNFLAAIEQSYKTGAVVTRLSVAGAGARAMGTTFAKPDCPTGLTSATSAEQALGMQGIGERHWHFGACQACLKLAMVGECDVCLSCEEADNRGEDLMAIHAKALAAQEANTRANQPYAAQETTHSSQEHVDDEFVRLIEQEYGPGAAVQNRVVVGNTVLDIVDRTGEVVASGISRAEFRASTY